MFIKKILFIIVLSFSFSQLMAFDIVNLEPHVDQKKELSVKQIMQTQEPVTASEKDNNLASDQKTNNDKKINMIDYCRKHTC